MTCHDAREQLSTLLDDALAASERESLEAHLATCAECRRELTQLRETVALLGRLPPVPAPAGFVDRVMTQVYRPSWPRRLLDALFRPLRVKLPLEAAALILVGVSALYVYQHTPEVQQLAREEARESSSVPSVAPGALPAPPASEPPVSAMAGKAAPSKDRALETKPVPARPEAAREEFRQASPAVPPPATAVGPGSAAPGGIGLESPSEGPKAGPEARPQVKPDVTPEPKPGTKPDMKKEAPAERRPDALGAASSSAGTEKAAQATEPSPLRDAAGARTPAAPAPAPPPATPPPATRGRAGSDVAAPPAARPTEGASDDAVASARSRTTALMRSVDASGRLAVSARAPAEAAIDALLRRLGGTRAARRLEGEQRLVVIDVLVPGARYPELVEGLRRIGRWTSDYELRTLPAEVRVEVALTVEP